MNMPAPEQPEERNPWETDPTHMPVSDSDLPEMADDPHGRIARLQSELEQANDRILRLQAEMENLRKRASREMNDQLRYASVPLVRDLLPVLDNIQRAVEAARQNPDSVDSLLNGVILVRQQLESILAQHHCREIEALEKPFDPNLHEAISEARSAEQSAGTVLHVARPGYLVHDRVVRPSQVVVVASRDNVTDATDENSEDHSRETR
jgi:molecular chaperone GrpE